MGSTDKNERQLKAQDESDSWTGEGSSKQLPTIGTLIHFVIVLIKDPSTLIRLSGGNGPHLLPHAARQRTESPHAMIESTR